MNERIESADDGAVESTEGDPSNQSFLLQNGSATFPTLFYPSNPLRLESHSLLLLLLLLFFFGILENKLPVVCTFDTPKTKTALCVADLTR